jgi:hypothetical protein
MAPTAQHKAPPTTGRSRDDVAKKKRDPELRAALASGANGTVAIYTTVVGNPANAVAALDGAHVAATPGGKAALVVGRIKVQQLPKLAGQRNVLSVNLVQLKQTGRPLGNPDPDIGSAKPSTKALRTAVSGLADRRPVCGRAADQGLELRRPQEARSARRQDARLRRCLEDGL